MYGPVIGKGGEGIVQRCVVKYNDVPVDAAVKTLLDSSDDAISITLDEIELLWSVHVFTLWDGCFGVSVFAFSCS